MSPAENSPAFRCSREEPISTRRVSLALSCLFVLLATASPHAAGSMRDVRLHGTASLRSAPSPDAPLVAALKDGAFVVLERLHCNADSVLYVGDTSTDMLTAKAAGMTSVGVAWGFRGSEELRIHGAQHIVSRADEILTLFEAML